VIFLEAVCFEGYSTLLAHEDHLVVLAALLSALFAVAAWPPLSTSVPQFHWLRPSKLMKGETELGYLLHWGACYE
jgi:hypothetical protein